MEYTLSKALEEIYDIYYENLSTKKDFSKKEKSLYDEDLLEEEEYSYDGDVLMETYEIILSLKKNNYEKFLNLSSIIVLEFFNIMYDKKYLEELIEYNSFDSDYNVEEEYSDILKDIKNNSKHVFISDILGEDNEYLYDMISLIADYHEFGDFEYMDFSCYQYDNFVKCLNTEEGREIYKKYHPNIELELKECNETLSDEKYIKQVEKLEIKSLFEYIYYILIYRQLVSKKYIHFLRFTFYGILQNLKFKNKKIYKDIILFLLGYYYMKKGLNNINKENMVYEDKKILEILNSNNLDNSYLEAPIYMLVEEFMNFDFIEYGNLTNDCDEETKKIIKKLTLNKNNN